MIHAAAVAPVFPVRDADASAAHYAALGFEVSGDGPYRFARSGDVYLHLAEFAELDPLTNSSAAYLYVDDADDLRARWLAAAVGGRITGIADTDYGLRESAHIDPDGNLIRFGSWLAGAGPPR